MSSGLLVAVVACTPPPAIQPQPQERAAHYVLLSFIQDGVTPRSEVQANLGVPSADFENKRILTYRIKLNGGNAEVVSSPWAPDIFSLVLVFDNDGLLQKHSLVGGGGAR